MKKVITAVAAMVMVLMSTVGVFAQDYDYNINVSVDGKALEFSDAKPFLSVSEGRTLLPVRAISESLGADVDWDSEARDVLITKGETSITLHIGDKFAMKNGKKVDFDTTARIISDRTYLPLRAVAGMLNCKVSWDGSKRLVSIDTKAYESVKTVPVKDVASNIGDFWGAKQVTTAKYMNPEAFEIGTDLRYGLTSIKMKADKTYLMTFLKGGKAVDVKIGYYGEGGYQYFPVPKGMTTDDFDEVGIYNNATDTLYVFSNPYK